jgi:hypothetical protein
MNKVYIDCFYYGFWIDKTELYKYNLTGKILYEKTENIYKNNNIKNNYSFIEEMQQKKCYGLFLKYIYDQIFTLYF